MEVIGRMTPRGIENLCEHTIFSLNYYLILRLSVLILYLRGPVLASFQTADTPYFCTSTVIQPWYPMFEMFGLNNDALAPTINRDFLETILPNHYFRARIAVTSSTKSLR